ncbi:MAG: hypothetical protein CMM93_03095 [Rickettsiales bacterium]|nr:hypothetical protein [Rickettsiales bacterium]|tara:strand:+ start:374 stop:1030 length:657 start_codon:yes stop_codon:yes gene_type:complete
MHYVKLHLSQLPGLDRLLFLTQNPTIEELTSNTNFVIKKVIHNDRELIGIKMRKELNATYYTFENVLTQMQVLPAGDYGELIEESKQLQGICSNQKYNSYDISVSDNQLDRFKEYLFGDSEINLPTSSISEIKFVKATRNFKEQIKNVIEEMELIDGEYWYFNCLNFIDTNSYKFDLLEITSNIVTIGRGKIIYLFEIGDNRALIDIRRVCPGKSANK